MRYKPEHLRRRAPRLAISATSARWGGRLLAASAVVVLLQGLVAAGLTSSRLSSAASPPADLGEPVLIPSGGWLPHPEVGGAAGQQLVEQLPVAVPARIEVPAIGITAPMRPVGLDDRGGLDVPVGGGTGWFERSSRPGEPGFAVIGGHVDSTRGPDVFYRLRELVAGNEIVVRTADGEVLTFRVDTVERQRKDALSTSRMWDDADRPMLALITCGGPFDRAKRTYRDNVIVYASAV